MLPVHTLSGGRTCAYVLVNNLCEENAPLTAQGLSGHGLTAKNEDIGACRMAAFVPRQLQVLMLTRFLIRACRFQFTRMAAA